MPFVRAVLVGLAGAWLAVIAWGGVRGDLRPVTVRASIGPALRGVTRIDLPPLGSLSARTHKGPVSLRLQLDQLHVEEAVEWLSENSSPADAAKRLDNDISQLAKRLVVRTLIVALAGAAIAGGLMGSGWRFMGIAIFCGTAAVAGPISVASFSFDRAAFSSPKFEGELSRAPYLLDAVQKSYTGAVKNLPLITDEIIDIYGRIEMNVPTADPVRTSNIRVLLISDLHNNPLGLRFALELAKSYSARLVLVCGDTTDFGLPIESDLLTEWKRFAVPVLFVTGNHDSQSTVEAMSDIPGIKVLDDGKRAKAAGLVISGYGDPAAKRIGTGSRDADQKDLKALAQQMIRDLKKQDPPDVVMVHNFRVARDAAGFAPVIVTGHSHSTFVERRKGSVIVNPGTTGAAGIRYFSSKRRVPYTAAVMHFARAEDGVALSAVDLVELMQPSGDFVVTRRNVSSQKTATK